MKEYMKWLIASAVIMFVLPCAAVAVGGIDLGVAMVTLTLMMFAVCPIYSVMLGVFAGRDGKRFWSLPVISPLLSLVGMGVLVDHGASGFARFAGIYLVLGLLAMLASMIVRKSAQPQITE